MLGGLWCADPRSMPVAPGFVRQVRPTGQGDLHPLIALTGRRRRVSHRWRFPLLCGGMVPVRSLPKDLGCGPGAVRREWLARISIDTCRSLVLGACVGLSGPVRPPPDHYAAIVARLALPLFVTRIGTDAILHARRRIIPLSGWLDARVCFTTISILFYGYVAAYRCTMRRDRS